MAVERVEKNELEARGMLYQFMAGKVTMEDLERWMESPFPGPCHLRALIISLYLYQKLQFECLPYPDREIRFRALLLQKRLRGDLGE